jgi:hypothetical protein
MKGISILVQTYAYRLKIKYLYLKIKGLTLSFRLCKFVYSKGGKEAGNKEKKNYEN